MRWRFRVVPDCISARRYARRSLACAELADACAVSFNFGGWKSRRKSDAEAMSRERRSLLSLRPALTQAAPTLA